MEEGARLYGYSQNPIGGYDALTFAAIIHYIEVLFARYDQTGNGVLNTSEALNFAVLARPQIATAANLPVTQTGTLDAIFTYVLNF